jgi:small subunit ribosomal protein S3
MPHRRVLKQALMKVMANKNVQGARIQAAGRLGGAEIARTEKLRMGRLPLQNLRASIDYSLKEAKTTYGMIGVKVWMYKGEKFE